MGIESLLRQKAEKEKTEVKSLSLVEFAPTQPTLPNQPIDTQPNPTHPTKNQPNQPTQPMRDFVKYPNSVTRNSDRLFRGMNKQTYDKLYNLTRGGFPNPSRSIQITKIELERITGFSDNTLAKHLKDLQTVGLIKITHQLGKHEGSIYEVFVPEETSNQPNPTNPTNPTQKVGPHPTQKIGLVGTGETSENKEDNSDIRFKFKDFKLIDDDLIEISEMFNEAAKRVTGNGLTKKDGEALRELVEIVIAETDIARTRTKSVSVYLKFAVENLRRRLYAEKSKGKSKKTFEPGKSESVETAVEPVEPLDNDIRQTVLESLRQMVKNNGRESVDFFKSNYTETDWSWLMANL